MKPKKTTIEGERDERRKALCDEIIHRAAKMMVEEVGASMGMMLDRVMTFAAAHACTIDGSPKTATAFRDLADKIEEGIFHSVTGEGNSHGRTH
ncbi:hypothetical protein [Ensifer adhaerens]|uniref:hypothetical protein n=1 Tax=Ensifer adhaerens TaxID=106592 RepID=UPI000FDB822A|nr:hypothetical protein [Ensifer adhaerens]MDF8353221.1 hypothetical protein [Ensifer adhaerens]THA67982.1 hypothetical protein E5176_07560 [Ensifer adhaerens]